MPLPGTRSLLVCRARLLVQRPSVYLHVPLIDDVELMHALVAHPHRSEIQLCGTYTVFVDVVSEVTDVLDSSGANRFQRSCCVRVARHRR